MNIYIKAEAKVLDLHKQAHRLSFDEKRKRYDEYILLLRKAAYAGNKEAQYDLGLHYDKESYWGVENPFYNSKKCIYWYEKSAEKNYDYALGKLGYKYDVGEDVPQDKEVAFKLYYKAYELGNAVAARNIATLYKERGEFEKVFEWFLKASAIGDGDNGDLDYELGNCYFLGYGVRRSYKQAYKYFIKAVKSSGISEYTREIALFMIGVMYFHGHFVEQSIGKAKFLISKANIDKDHEDILVFYNRHSDAFINVKEEHVDL